jgi:hypothetical protein
LADRVQSTPASVLTLFKEAGMAPRPHALTGPEQQLIAEAFTTLPPLHQRILRAHLQSISLLDEMPNTALTSLESGEAPFQVFHITLRAAILSQTVSAWATEKERTCFDFANSPVDVGPRPAFEYVLLHEATHIVDAVLHLTPAASVKGKLPGSAAAHPFTAGVWQDRTTVVPAYRDTLLTTIRFRRGGRLLPVGQATQVYTALQRTPFESLYGSSAWTEDLAEYVSVHHFTHKLKQPFRVVIHNGPQEVFRYEPMKKVLVQRRRRVMKRFYS